MAGVPTASRPVPTDGGMTGPSLSPGGGRPFKAEVEEPRRGETQAHSSGGSAAAPGNMRSDDARPEIGASGYLCTAVVPAPAVPVTTDH